MSVLSIIGAFKKRPDHLADIVGRVLVAAAIAAVPLSFAAFAGALVSALLLAVGAPPITYAFVLFASLMSFRAAVRHPSHGMDGCTKTFALIASGYAIAWAIVSFEATGGLTAFEADAISLRWLQPPLAALPFATLILRLSGKKKRSGWLFMGAMVFLSAWMSVLFFPIENGYAEGLLPDSDWLRFPLAALAVTAVLGLIRLSFVLRAPPSVRRVRLRDFNKNSRIFALIMIAFGLAWATARAVVGIAV